MKNNYYSIYPCINIYERPSINSKISSQIIYGEKFKVFKKVKNFLKIKTFYDRYHGYIKNKKFKKKIKTTHKVKVLKTRIFKRFFVDINIWIVAKKIIFHLFLLYAL